ncbi:SDR family NAD(P)-dependent oxidoreductase [Parasedimentitalea psychrophila]|uniref:SDR family NAD(P)-dependent oxidoreductase n=1 Tax=Parasedimentitalea psychrophila TaxID=2997337 RepID=A0A9Y2L2X5_9RHOB|nr:SDR family NAD(P)-dependent oxidoreductase [Parasedimentitalea psychrophila]WIY25894.1 SDR family NAD(P)-dependent oxidoreductase [Parasedimentitalea psychrophila]
MHVVVTGSSRGIGREIVSRLRGAGHAVTGTARDHSADARLEVSDPGQQARLAAQLKGQPVDLLVCNAGVFLDKNMALEDYSAEIWASSLATNVTGVFLTVQALLPNLRLVTEPKIAIISSQMASHALAPGGAYAYRASKAAAVSIGRNLAVDLQPEGIAVGIYHPGWVRTDMGGDQGEISVQDSAEGLLNEFEVLNVATSGCFHTWDGRIQAF